MTEALKNYKVLKSSLAAGNIEHAGLHQQASNANSQASNAGVAANNLNALKGKRKGLLGLRFLGKTQDTTTEIDLQIAQANSSLAEAADKFDSAEAAAEIIYAEANVLGQELNEMAADLPRLRYYAAVEVVERLAMRYKATVEAMLNSYAPLVAACRLVDQLCDPLNGLPALGSHNFNSTIEIQTNSLLVATQSLNRWQNLNDHIQAHMPAILAELES